MPTIPKITPYRLRKWGACYPDYKIAELYAGRRSLTPLDICALKIPAADKLWALLRPAILPAAELHRLGLEFARTVLPVESRPRKLARLLLQAKEMWLRRQLSADELRQAGQLYAHEAGRWYRTAIAFAADTDPYVAARMSCEYAAGHQGGRGSNAHDRAMRGYLRRVRAALVRRYGARATSKGGG